MDALDGGLILGGITGRAVFDLAGENVADQLAELDRIAGALKALCCHRGSMPLVRARCERAEFQTVPLPGGVVALTWIAMDVVQFADWLAGKLASGELPFPT